MFCWPCLIEYEDNLAQIYMYSIMRPQRRPGWPILLRNKSRNTVGSGTPCILPGAFYHILEKKEKVCSCAFGCILKCMGDLGSDLMVCKARLLINSLELTLQSLTPPMLKWYTSPDSMPLNEIQTDAAPPDRKSCIPAMYTNICTHTHHKKVWNSGIQ